MGKYYENEFTEALNTQNFNYHDDMTQVENFTREYILRYGYILTDIKVLNNECQQRKLVIGFSMSDGGVSSILLTINHMP